MQVRHSNQTTVDLPDGSVVVTGHCRVNGSEYSVSVFPEAYERWCSGTLIQNAFPNMRAKDREWLQTGISPSGYDSLFPQDD